MRLSNIRASVLANVLILVVFFIYGCAQTPMTMPVSELKLPETKYSHITKETVIPENSVVSENVFKHKVLPRETLGAIAKKYGVYVEDIKLANSLSDDSITAGTEIIIPFSAGPKEVSKTNSVTVIRYKVKKGDNLSKIAKRHNVTVARIISLNKIKDDRKLKVGQIILIEKPETSNQ